jgi:hypothetical protein
MMKKFIEGEFNTKEDDLINSLIMEKADDIASNLTQLECVLNNIKCFNTTLEGDTEVMTFTEEAQDIFDVYYDQYTTELYDLLNRQLSALENGK